MRYNRLGIKEIIGAILGCTLPTAHIFAGAWVRAPQEIYSKLSISQFKSDEIYGPKNNKKLPGPDFTDISVNSYVEYGFNSQWTGITSITYKSLSSETLGVERTAAGLSDAWLYLKRSVRTAPFVVSIQGGVKIPLGYSDRTVPPLGDGQIDLELRGLAGKSFYPLPLYGSAEIGYRKRNGDLSDEIPFRVEGGVYAHKNILFTLALDGISNRSNDAASKTGNRAPHVFDEEYTTISPAVILMTKKGFSYELFYRTLISGGNTASGDTIGIGVSWQGIVN